MIWYKTIIGISLLKWTENKKELEIYLNDIKNIEKQKWGLGYIINIKTKDDKEYKITAGVINNKILLNIKSMLT